MLDKKTFCLKITKLKSITSQYINDNCKELGITHSEALYLKAIADSDNITQKQLSEMLGYDKARACRVLADLEAQGYVLRLVDKKDSRKSTYIPTDAGRSIVNKLDQKLEQFMQDISFADIPKEQIEIFFATVDKMIDNISKYNQGDQDEKTI